MCYKESGGQNRGGWLTVKVESALEAILLTVHGFARYEEEPDQFAYIREINVCHSGFDIYGQRVCLQSF
ncbi:MAG: hypothetical protein R3C56_17815 [Pirellulaceae bacterium]